ncbi:putative calcium-binding protein CML46 [Curcuma longa]|uniref:putative calcium-binding protein CML46 n=1 Tax=Curcuma longa TaxID=136217 RepID=UPI003D9F3FDD
MEKSSSPAAASLALSDPILLLLFQTISFWFVFRKLALRFLSYRRSAVPNLHDLEDRLDLAPEDVAAVMEAIGVRGDGVDGGFEGPGDLARMFVERAPSLEELEAAFQVFDEGRDGFIDAAELRRVMTRLGLVEGTGIDGCRRMIAVYDKNGDGRIDFEEFVDFMETTFVC